MLLTGSPHILSQQVETLKHYSDKVDLWKQTGPEELSTHPGLLPSIDLKNLNVQIVYSAAYQRAAATYRNPFTKVAVSKKMDIVLERETSPHRFSLTREQAISFSSTLSAIGNNQASKEMRQINIPEEIVDFEYIRTDLAEYF